MKNRLNWIIIFLLLIVFIISSYKGKEASMIVFKGNMADLKNDSLFLFKTDSYFPGLKSDLYIGKTKCEANGDFHFNIPNAEAGYYQIITNNYGRIAYDIYLEPGDSISLYQSPWKDEPKFIIEGKGSQKLTHLKTDFEIFNKNRAFYNTLNSKQFDTLSDFKAFIDSIGQKRIDQANKHDVPAPIKQRFIKDIKLETATFFLDHLKRRNYIMNGEFSYLLPEQKYIPTILNNLSTEDFERTATKKVLEPYLEYLVQKQLEGNTKEKEGALFSTKLQIINQEPNKTLKNQLALAVLTNFSLAMFEEDFFENIEAFHSDVKTSLVDDDNVAEIFNKNFSEYSLLQPKKMAPDFSLPNIDGKLVKLSDFKGKVVYIDIWGTWCGPCIQEIPNSIKLQEEFKDKDVVFLFIALQADEEQIAEWKEFILGKHQRAKKLFGENGFPGVHLVAENQFSNAQLSPYKINFVPTYMLIDKEGRIVSTRAPRPLEVKQKLRELLLK